MADVKTAPVAPAATPKPEAKPKAEKGPGAAVFPTADAAVTEAGKRTTGHRRAFKLTMPDGTAKFAVAHNPHHAASLAFTTLGGKVEEIGKAPRAKAVASVDSLMAALAALPEEERKKVMEQLKTLKK